MTDELPRGWAWSTVGELGEYQNGRAFSSRDWGDEGRPIIRIQNLTGTSSQFNKFSGDVEGRHVVLAGDLLVSWAATLGVFVWRGPEAVLNQHIFKVKPHLTPRFMHHALTWALDAMRQQTHGSGMVHITKGKFEVVRLPVPPLGEQIRIVEELERRLSHVDAAERTLNVATSKLKAARAAIEHHLLWGEAVEYESLGDLLSDNLANGRSVKDRPGGFPVLRLTCLINGRIELSETKEGDWNRAEASKYLVRENDFLVSRGNGSLALVGRGGLVPPDPPEVAYPDTLIRVRVDQELLVPAYLAAVWNSRGVRTQLEGMARTTAGIYKVNQDHLKSVKLPVPDKASQRRVVEELDRRLSLLLSSGRAADVNGDRCTALKRSLLQAAFSGQLVSQDPDDEPAEVLLERIREARAVTAPMKKTRTKRKKGVEA